MAETNNPTLALGVGMKGNMHGDAFFLASFLASFLARTADYADDIERVLALIDRHGDVETPRKPRGLAAITEVLDARTSPTLLRLTAARQRSKDLLGCRQALKACAAVNAVA